MEAVTGVNVVWVGDITYIALKDGRFLYLAIWMDLGNRLIVGWQLSPAMNASIVIRSLQKAIAWRRPPPGLIVHSDGGGQYMDTAFRQLLASNRFSQSMTRVENHYDNAFAESFFSRLKAELMQGKPFETEAEAHAKIFEYIEIYHNRKRRHSELGYKSPNDFDQQSPGKQPIHVFFKSR